MCIATVLGCQVKAAPSLLREAVRTLANLAAFGKFKWIDIDARAKVEKKNQEGRNRRKRKKSRKAER